MAPGLVSIDWVPIAAVAGPVIAVVSGAALAARQVRNELRARDARRYYLEGGLFRLSATFDEMIGTARLNFAICMHLLRILRDIDPAGLIALPASDLPSLIPMVVNGSAFNSIRPSSVIANVGLGEVTTSAFAEIFNFHLDLLVQVVLPIKAIYSARSPMSEGQRSDLFARLSQLAESNYHRMERFQELPLILRNMGIRAADLGIRSLDDGRRIGADVKMNPLTVQMADLVKHTSGKTGGSD